MSKQDCLNIESETNVKYLQEIVKVLHDSNLHLQEKIKNKEGSQILNYLNLAMIYQKQEEYNKKIVELDNALVLKNNEIKKGERKFLPPFSIDILVL